MEASVKKALDNTIATLLKSDEPSVRFKVLVHVLERDRQSAEVKHLQEQIKASSRVQRLLSERDETGSLPYHPYAKWYGAHWVLADLADLGYPPGDASLLPLREQVYGWLFGQSHQSRIRAIAGRVRRCASQEGNAVTSLLRLGLADERTDELAQRLTTWQWPDGGWNCDKNPRATHSSFMESLIPLRALALHAQVTGNRRSREAAERVAEIFLKRRLYKRQADGSVIQADFVRLHYPCYWHYDILFGLKVMAEAGLIGDLRCQEALALLESKRLPDGGFPAEKKYYRVTDRRTSGRSLVDWGGTGQRRMNEWVTADALSVLKAAGRL
jgi:hypothetical protein